MNLLLLLKSVPLVIVTLLLPLFGAFAYGCVLVYNRYLAHRTGKFIGMNRVVYKTPFLILLTVQTVLSAVIWFKVGGGSESNVLSGSGWTSVFFGLASGSVQSSFKVDMFGAFSGALAAYAALAGGLCALAEREEPLTPRRIVFLLLAVAGVQGIFYQNNLLALFVFMIIAQTGVTGLFSNYSPDRSSLRKNAFYYASRVILLGMFLAGVLLLRAEYGVTNMTVLAAARMPSHTTSLALILLAVPPLYIFIKPSPFMKSPSRSTFFLLRTQVSLFILFRIFFTLFGPMSGLEKMPALFVLVGLAVIAYSLIISVREVCPENFMDMIVFYLKGAILAAIGIAMNGTFAAGNAALYGIGALEAAISLWLVFLPITMTISFIMSFLKIKEDNGTEIWKNGSLWRKSRFMTLMLMLAVGMIAGLPPFAGYSGKQLLLRSANFISPYLCCVLFIFAVLMLFISLRCVFVFMTEGEESDDSFKMERSPMFLPLIMFMIIFVYATAAPGHVFDSVLSPAVDSLVNRPVAITTQTEEMK
ncbi:MAG: hypothetical protein Q4E17_04860 [Synergistes sp.]|nr:hypothetical protein [Synergistes sp.]